MAGRVNIEIRGSFTIWNILRKFIQIISERKDRDYNLLHPRAEMICKKYLKKMFFFLRKIRTYNICINIPTCDIVQKIFAPFWNAILLSLDKINTFKRLIKSSLFFNLIFASQQTEYVHHYFSADNNHQMTNLIHCN